MWADTLNTSSLSINSWPVRLHNQDNSKSFYSQNVYLSVWCCFIDNREIFPVTVLSSCLLSLTTQSEIMAAAYFQPMETSKNLNGTRDISMYFTRNRISMNHRAFLLFFPFFCVGRVNFKTTKIVKALGISSSNAFYSKRLWKQRTCKEISTISFIILTINMLTYGRRLQWATK